MSDSERIYLDLDPELRAWLADHEIDIADILREQGVEARVQRAPLPPRNTRTSAHATWCRWYWPPR